MRVWKITDGGCINGPIVDIVTSDECVTPQQVIDSWRSALGHFIGSPSGKVAAIEVWHVKTPSRAERLKQLEAEIAALIASDEEES